jgi:hypothetical protein
LVIGLALGLVLGLHAKPRLRKAAFTGCVLCECAAEGLQAGS